MKPTTPLARSAGKLALTAPLCALLMHIALPIEQPVTVLVAFAYVTLGPAAGYTFVYAAITLWLLLERLCGKDRF